MFNYSPDGAVTLSLCDVSSIRLDLAMPPLLPIQRGDYKYFTALTRENAAFPIRYSLARRVLPL